MKLVFVSLLSLGCFLSAAAQDDKGQPAKGLNLPIDTTTQLVTYSGEVKVDISREDLFNRAMEWLDTAFRYSGPGLWTADPGTGKIVCKESILEILPAYIYATLTFTVSFKIENGGYKYKVTNLYFDRIAAGGVPNVPVEPMMHATRKQYDAWVGSGSIGGYQGQLNKFLEPVDGLMQNLVASLHHSMTRDTSGDKNTW